MPVGAGKLPAVAGSPLVVLLCFGFIKGLVFRLYYRGCHSPGKELAVRGCGPFKRCHVSPGTAVSGNAFPNAWTPRISFILKWPSALYFFLN